MSISIPLWMDASRIFPSVNSLKESKCSKESGKILPFVKRRPWGSSVDCILSLASDGTFVLTPKCVETKYTDGNPLSEKIEEYRTASHDLVVKTEDRKEVTSSGLLDLRGSWNVVANPYCVTDRYYDNVSLRSYPRQKIAKLKGKKSSAPAKEKVLLSNELSLNCRMWGRYSRQNGKRGTQRYRMTHGTLVCRDHCIPWWKKFFRPVVGSFSAIRSSSIPKHEGWIDKEQFGYSAE